MQAAVVDKFINYLIDIENQILDKPNMSRDFVYVVHLVLWYWPLGCIWWQSNKYRITDNKVALKVNAPSLLYIEVSIL